jgi:hypothetical protein
MADRGYPVEDFELQSELVSVDHPDLVRTTATHTGYTRRAQLAKRPLRISAGP